MGHILDVLDGLMNDLWLGDRPIQESLYFLLKCFYAIDCVVGRGLSSKNVHQLGHIEVTACRNVRDLNRWFVFERLDVCGMLVNCGLIYDQKKFDKLDETENLVLICATYDPQIARLFRANIRRSSC